jgi:hypothetical protein
MPLPIGTPPERPDAGDGARPSAWAVLAFCVGLVSGAALAVAAAADAPVLVGTVGVLVGAMTATVLVVRDAWRRRLGVARMLWRVVSAPIRFLLDVVP